MTVPAVHLCFSCTDSLNEMECQHHHRDDAGDDARWKNFVKQAVILWCAGFREACCIHRVVFFCRRSRPLLRRTGQCFLFNGFIFLGSIFLLKYVITPLLQWILPVQPKHLDAVEGHDYQILEAGGRLYKLLQIILIGFFYVFWFYPMYVFSFIISSLWYNEIACQAFNVMEQTQQDSQRRNSNSDRLSSSEFAINQGDDHGGLERTMTMIGEQIYSVLMLSVFFIEVFAVGFIPYVGQMLAFVLLSWIYAYYCFEYKWNLARWSLEKRLLFFEKNWAFFAGFGSPCVLATFFFTQLVSYGVMAMLFPLFVLAATATSPKQVIDSYSKKKTSGELRRVPVFYVANATSLQVVQLLSLLPSLANRAKKGQ